MTTVVPVISRLKLGRILREWRTLAGCSPRTWIVEELPFLQDDSVFAGQD